MSKKNKKGMLPSAEASGLESITSQDIQADLVGSTSMNSQSLNQPQTSIADEATATVEEETHKGNETTTSVPVADETHKEEEPTCEFRTRFMQPLPRGSTHNDNRQKQATEGQWSHNEEHQASP